MLPGWISFSKSSIRLETKAIRLMNGSKKGRRAVRCPIESKSKGMPYFALGRSRPKSTKRTNKFRSTISLSLSLFYTPTKSLQTIDLQSLSRHFTNLQYQLIVTSSDLSRNRKYSNMRSAVFLVGALAAMVIADGSYTETVFETATITEYSCGPEVSCPYQHASTRTVEVGSVVSSENAPAEATFPCTTTATSPVNTIFQSTPPSSIAPPPAGKSLFISPMFHMELLKTLTILIIF